MSKLWSTHPLYTTLIGILQKKGGALTDKELYKALKGRNIDLNVKALNETLMKLEVDGLIHVLSLTKTQKRIELRKP